MAESKTKKAQRAYELAPDAKMERQTQLQQLGLELRQYVRALNNHELLSDAWLDMIKQIHEVTYCIMCVLSLHVCLVFCVCFVCA
jgi:urease accessory protein UreF